MCSFQTSTGTRLMLRVDEKMGVAAVDEEDELLLVFCRLAGGEELLLEDIFRERERERDDSQVYT